MSIVLTVAPPDGWRTWPAARIEEWFTNHRRVIRSVGLSYEVDSLKLTVLRRLEQGAKGRRFPILDALHFDGGVLPSASIRPFLAETNGLAGALRLLPATEVLSLRNYFARLDLALPPPALAARVDAEWATVVDGTTPLAPLDAAELAFETAAFLAAYPRRRRLISAFDLFSHILRAYRIVGRNAARRGRGVVLG